MDKTTLIFLAAGLVGGALKAMLSNSQGTFSKKSFADVVTAGFVGMLWPIMGPIPLPETANVLQQAGFIAFISYTASHVLTSALGKAGLPIDPGVVPR